MERPIKDLPAWRRAEVANLQAINDSNYERDKGLWLSAAEEWRGNQIRNRVGGRAVEPFTNPKPVRTVITGLADDGQYVSKPVDDPGLKVPDLPPEEATAPSTPGLGPDARAVPDDDADFKAAIM